MQNVKKLEEAIKKWKIVVESAKEVRKRLEKEEIKKK